MEKKLFSKKDLWIVTVLLAAGVLFLLLRGAPAGRTAVVERNGREVLRRELSALTGPEEVTVPGEEGLTVTVTFSPEGAAVTAADCRDKVCVHTGLLTGAGQTAICLPARISLRLEGGSGPDAVTF